MEYNSKQEQMMKNFFSTSLFILASVFMLLAGCKEDELPLPGENGTASHELPVRLAETDYTPENTTIC